MQHECYCFKVELRKLKQDSSSGSRSLPGFQEQSWTGGLGPDTKQSLLPALPASLFSLPNDYCRLECHLVPGLRKTKRWAAQISLTALQRRSGCWGARRQWFREGKEGHKETDEGAGCSVRSLPDPTCRSILWGVARSTAIAGTGWKPLTGSCLSPTPESFFQAVTQMPRLTQMHRGWHEQILEKILGWLTAHTTGMRSKAGTQKCSKCRSIPWQETSKSVFLLSCVNSHYSWNLI